MYRSVISNYEDKQKELMVENADLRQCLRDMQRELVGLLNTPDSSIGVSISNSSPEVCIEVSCRVFVNSSVSIL